MGVKGLSQFCKNNLDEVSEEVDLVEQALLSSDGRIEILVDYYGFLFYINEIAERFVSDETLNNFVRIVGGEYQALNYCLKNFIHTLNFVGIDLVFFQDGPTASDVGVMEQKYEELRQRFDKREKINEMVTNICKSYAGMDGLTDSILPLLASHQVASTLIEQKKALPNLKYFICRGEAELAMGKYLVDNPGKAFAVLGRDSDFMVLSNCRYIPLEQKFFDIDYDLTPHLMDRIIMLEQLNVRIVTPDSVQRSLKLSSHQDLVEIAILSGNDFTKPFLEKYKIHDLIEVSGVIEVAHWFVERIGLGSRLEDDPDWRKFIESDPQILQSIDYSRRFYDLNLEFSYDDPETLALFQLLKARVDAHAAPRDVLGWLHGIHRRSNYVEYHSLGAPLMEHDLTVFRQYLYPLALGPTSHIDSITETGRTPWSAFDEVVVSLPQMPKQTMQFEDVDISYRYGIFDTLMTILDDNGEQMRLLGFDHENYDQKSFSRNFFEYLSPTEAFFAYLLNYLLSMSLSPHAVVLLTSAELSAVAHSIFDFYWRSLENDYNPYEEGPLPTNKPPDIKCITLNNWCQAVYKEMRDACICLRFDDLIAPPGYAFDGIRFWKFFSYFVEQNGNEVDTNVAEILNEIVRQHPNRMADRFAIDFSEKGHDQGIDIDYLLPQGVEDSEERENQQLENSSTETTLPILSHRESLMSAIRNQRVTCIEGETGCGKSTQVPQFILDDYESFPSEYDRPVKILVTQPRRIAARSLAERVAKERKVELGHEIGYRIGQDYMSCYQTRILFATTGYVRTALTHNDRMLDEYTHLVLDEVHERELENDLLSLIVKLLVKDRPIKLVVMSATIQGDLFLRYFASALEIRRMPQRVIFVGARRYPVEDVFLEDLPSRFPHAFSDDDKFRILKNSCKLNKKSSSFYQDSENEGYLSDMTQQGFKSLQALSVEMSEMNLNYVPSYTASSTKIALDLLPEFRHILMRLLPSLVVPGESVLVFLPGRAQIDELFDELTCIESDPSHSGWPCRIRVFVLHSMVPFDDQLEAFDDPPGFKSHIILATNVAESSVTLPKVRVVVDYGLHRRPVYHADRRMTMLDLSWCSKASSRQRRGRTGRVFTGICIKMFTREFFESLSPFDPPQMHDSPLDNLVLQVKGIARIISPGSTPTELLLQSIEPPKTENIQEAVQTLADIGAIEENDEMSDLTLLGHIGMNLPIDLRYSRLILYGILFGVSCDGIVLAAAVQSKDPFTQPTKMIIKDDQKFIYALDSSTSSRKFFDGDIFSEPIMLRNLFVHWLYALHEFNLEKRNWGQTNEKGEYIPKNIAELKHRFCRVRSVMEKRFNAFENLVGDLAWKAREIAPLGEARSKIEKLISMLPHHFRKPRERNQSHPDAAKWEAYSRDLSVADLFVPINGCYNTPSKIKGFVSENPVKEKAQALKLYAIIVAALSPLFLEGNVMPEENSNEKRKKPKNRGRDMADAMTGLGIDPKRSLGFVEVPSIFRPRRVANVRKKEKLGTMEEDKGGDDAGDLVYEGENFKMEMFKNIFSRMAVGVAKAIPSQANPSSVFLEFENQKEALLPFAGETRDDIVRVFENVPNGLQSIYKFSEGKSTFLVQVPSEMRRGVVGLPETQIRESTVEFITPRQPYRVDWNLLSAGGYSLKHCKGTCQWRNPIGFACDVAKKKFYAVGANYVASSESNGWIDNVTVLPPDNNNLVALVLLFAFLGDQYGMELTVDVANQLVNGFRVFDHAFNFPNQQSLTKSLMEKINAVRSRVSEIIDGDSLTHTTHGTHSAVIRGDVSSLLSDVLESLLTHGPSQNQPPTTMITDNIYLGPPSKLLSNAAKGAGTKQPDIRVLSPYAKTRGTVDLEAENGNRTRGKRFQFLRPFDLRILEPKSKVDPLSTLRSSLNNLSLSQKSPVRKSRQIGPNSPIPKSSKESQRSKGIKKSEEINDSSSSFSSSVSVSFDEDDELGAAPPPCSELEGKKKIAFELKKKTKLKKPAKEFVEDFPNFEDLVTSKSRKVSTTAQKILAQSGPPTLIKKPSKNKNMKSKVYSNGLSSAVDGTFVETFTTPAPLHLPDLKYLKKKLLRRLISRLTDKYRPNHFQDVYSARPFDVPPSFEEILRDPHVQKLMAMMSWTSQDLRTFLEKSPFFEEENALWSLTTCGRTAALGDDDYEEYAIFYMLQFFRGIRVRAWIDDMIPYVKLNVQQLFHLAMTDPRLHVSKHEASGHYAISLASQEFETEFDQVLESVYKKSKRSQIPIAQLVSHPHLQSVARRFYPSLMHLLPLDCDDVNTTKTIIKTLLSGKKSENAPSKDGDNDDGDCDGLCSLVSKRVSRIDFPLVPPRKISARKYSPPGSPDGTDKSSGSAESR